MKVVNISVINFFSYFRSPSPVDLVSCPWDYYTQTAVIAGTSAKGIDRIRNDLIRVDVGHDPLIHLL